ncbi:hypothetical protein [Chitinimonas lacunae]|uniref:DUF4142 domain-containing protein n=1 Tax=Chitinimonas lacunae TaxID=1963018 RepID=A0ABV8MTV0_9NEIS
MPLPIRLALVLSLTVSAVQAADPVRPSQEISDAAVYAWQFEQARIMVELSAQHCHRRAAGDVARQLDGEIEATLALLEEKHPGVQAQIRQIRRLTPAPINAALRRHSGDVTKPVKALFKEAGKDRHLNNTLCRELASSFRKARQSGDDLFSLEPAMLSLLQNTDLERFRSQAAQLDPAGPLD